MKPILRWPLLVGVALLAAWAGYRAGQPQAPVTTPIQDGDALPALLRAPLTDLNGQPSPLPLAPGRLVVINFWATWCPPCRAEMPAFSRIQQTFAGKNVQFVGIALDGVEPVKDFLRVAPVSYPILLAPPERLTMTASLGNGSQGLPFSLIVDGDGKLRASHLGQWQEADLSAQIAALLPR
ncbi:TlpA disulfide reductase family protein [Denitratisoma sp. agr-D3]